MQRLSRYDLLRGAAKNKFSKSFKEKRQPDGCHKQNNLFLVDHRSQNNTLDGKVENDIEMNEKLAKSKRAEQVFVRHAFRYFMGRNETLGDSNTLQDAHAAYRRSGGSFRVLTESLLSSDSFLMRQSVSNRGD